MDPAKTKPNPDLYTGSLTSLSWGSGGPIGDIPPGAKQPTASGELDSLNSKGQVIPPGTSVEVPTIPIPSPCRCAIRRQARSSTSSPIPRARCTTRQRVRLVKPDGSTQVVGQAKEATQMNVPNVGLVSTTRASLRVRKTTVVLRCARVNNPAVSGPDGKSTYQSRTRLQDHLCQDQPAAGSARLATIRRPDSE